MSGNVTPETTIATEKGKPAAGAGSTADLTRAHHQERLPTPLGRYGGLENLSVDVTLRNRDRLPFAVAYFIGASLRGLCFGLWLSHAVERRVVGIFKVVERMVSRIGKCNPYSPR